MADIDYWFSVASTYNFLTAMRLDGVERASGLTFRWRPFDLRRILLDMNNVPFSGKPVKMSYMWRDVQRRAAGYGIEAKLPAPYPLQHSVVGAQIALLGMREGWGKDFVRAGYKAWFQRGLEPFVEPILTETLSGLGLTTDKVIAEASGETNKRLLDDETEHARSLGVFGSPTFVVERELFWGDDRLEDAIAWCKGGSLGKS